MRETRYTATRSGRVHSEKPIINIIRNYSTAGSNDLCRSTYVLRSNNRYRYSENREAPRSTISRNRNSVSRHRDSHRSPMGIVGMNVARLWLVVCPSMFSR